MSFELSIPPSLRQILAVALVLVPVLVLAGAAWGFVADVLQHRERIALLKREKAEYEALLQARPKWDLQLARLRHAVAGDKLLYTGKTVEGDAKKMQARIAALIGAAGATGLQDKINIGASGADGPTQIHDDAAFSSTMAQLRTVLFQLKLSQPLLFATRLNVRASDAANPGRLQVDLQVLGFTSPL
jgi:hypothetical protein